MPDQSWHLRKVAELREVHFGTFRWFGSWRGPFRNGHGKIPVSIGQLQKNPKFDIAFFFFAGKRFALEVNSTNFRCLTKDFSSHPELLHIKMLLETSLYANLLMFPQSQSLISPFKWTQIRWNLDISIAEPPISTNKDPRLASLSILC